MTQTHKVNAPKIKAWDRAQRLEKIMSTERWDIIIVGGGITGAGIFKMASLIGLKVLLLEQCDFAWGTSSRSSKMVHGGLRYIAKGQIGLTRESVHERELLLKQAPGLVNKQNFTMAHYSGQFPSGWLFRTLLKVYDRFSGKKQHKKLSKEQLNMLVPDLRQQKLQGGTQFTDALTDDARLVLRLIQEAEQHGGTSLNYAKVMDVERKNNLYQQVTLNCEEHEKTIQLNCKILINATGVWADNLGSSIDVPFKIRPLRGSHLVIAPWRLPVYTVVTLTHPDDKRPVMIYPWCNITLIGTTDLEHEDQLNTEASISQQELEYLLKAVNHQFPDAKITASDVISTFAGVRPVIDSGQSLSASDEKREHQIIQQGGVIHISGGKLTTFRIIAKEVLEQVLGTLGISDKKLLDQNELIFDIATDASELPEQWVLPISGRYGSGTTQFIKSVPSHLLCPVAYTPTLWAELLWSCQYEQVMHLDDLLFRRSRIGNLLALGGTVELNKIKKLCLPILGWSESKWKAEVNRYLDIWYQHYSLPTDSRNERSKR